MMQVLEFQADDDDQRKCWNEVDKVGLVWWIGVFGFLKWRRWWCQLNGHPNVSRDQDKIKKVDGYEVGWEGEVERRNKRQSFLNDLELLFLFCLVCVCVCDLNLMTRRIHGKEKEERLRDNQSTTWWVQQCQEQIKLWKSSNPEEEDLDGCLDWRN